MNTLQKIIESKRSLRRDLSGQSVAAKLRLLEVLRDRLLTTVRKTSS